MMKEKLLPGISDYIKDIIEAFDTIPEERKAILREISAYVESGRSSVESTNLIFICTHNSRRSHMSQLWAQVAAHYYDIPGIECYSGGTEATAFNPRSVGAMRKTGFEIDQISSGSNPVYMVKYAMNTDPVKSFSKKFSDPFNPQDNFAAIMTCTDADEACPFVSGANLRVALPYEDPKITDGTPQEKESYDLRCRQIAIEMFYSFRIG